MKLIDKLDFSNGKVVRDKFIDLDRSICEQEDELTEDMFQVEFPNNLLIDIGWVPEIDCNGNFRVYLIKRQNWEKPLLFFEPGNFNELIVAIENCFKKIKE